MKYPCLVDKRCCTVPVRVQIRGTEVNEDGELELLADLNETCNLQMGARISFTKDKEKVELSGVALFIGDIAPDVNIIAAGTAIINDVEYDINRGKKNYNPDGTVNYTTLELI